jgi:hypothetical protein
VVNGSHEATDRCPLQAGDDAIGNLQRQIGPGAAETAPGPAGPETNAKLPSVRALPPHPAVRCVRGHGRSKQEKDALEMLGHQSEEAVRCLDRTVYK